MIHIHIWRSPFKGICARSPSRNFFGASATWLHKYCKRWRISLRRKSNVKRIPIHLRLPKLKRYFALFRIRLMADENKRGYDAKWGMFPLRNRWSLDQVPAGFFAPKTTLEHKGASRVHIAANEAADDHRECTLQAHVSAFCARCKVILLLCVLL